MDSRHPGSSRAPVPPAILALFAIDLLLAAGYYINYLAGRPFQMVNIQIDLGAETNFTTWYASAKWLLVAASFVLSTLVILLSPLARLRALPQPVAA